MHGCAAKDQIKSRCNAQRLSCLLSAVPLRTQLDARHMGMGMGHTLVRCAVVTGIWQSASAQSSVARTTIGVVASLWCAVTHPHCTHLSA